MMNANFKLKTRQQKQQIGSRRIKTQVNENTKKISFYLNKPFKQPLKQNKKILNQSQQNNVPTLYSQIKRQKPIKSIASKNITVSKLTTEPYERNYVMTLGQKTAIDKIFISSKQSNNKSRDLYTRKQALKGNEKKQGEIKIQGLARYVFQDKVGAGTFGTVHKARDKKTLEVVAIKKVYQDKRYKNRQLQILKLLNHPNVLRMKDCFYTYQNDRQYLNVVMDFFSQNLYQSIQKHKGRSEMPRLKIKILAYQMFRSLLYLNKLHIAHRDIKPQNILVNDNNWSLIICDFGSAKQLKQGQPNISYICSRCYRAPQLIFGSTAYTTQIDIWSIGCVIVEMIIMEPLFRAQSNIDQLVEIIKVLGTPSYNEMLQMNPDCDFQKYQLPQIKTKNWEKVIKRKNLGENFYDLLKKILLYSPFKRITAYQALLHPFFDQIKQQEIYVKLKKQQKVPDIFDFHQTKELDEQKLKKLIPSWYYKN